MAASGAPYAPASVSAYGATTARPFCSHAWSTSRRVTPARAAARERLGEAADRTGQPGLGQLNVQGIDDLLRGGATRAGLDHAEHGRDARRRDGHSPVRGGERAVERDRELFLTPGRGAQRRRARRRDVTRRTDELHARHRHRARPRRRGRVGLRARRATRGEERGRDEHGADAAKGDLHAGMTLRGGSGFPERAPGGQDPGSSRNATVLSTRGSPGSPSTRSPITLRWICSVPPPMRLLHCMRNCCCQ